MNSFTIILPVYNDWHSLGVLLKQIEKLLIKTKNKFRLLLINDGSTEKMSLKIKKSFYKNIEILNLKKNIGSQKAIATGLKYLLKNNNDNQKHFIIMDSDGEDDPKKIIKIINIVSKNKDTNFITLNRTIRKESLLFSILYEVHLLLTFIITLKYIRFGNFTYLSKNSLKKISNKKELWLAFSATVCKFLKKDYSIIASRKKRISGKSKMSYLNLIKHSINIQNVFKKNIFLTYIIYSFLISILFSSSFSFNIIFILITLFIFHFFIIVFFSQKMANGVTFNQCLNNIESIKKL
tara:strand:- start:2411 stop:3292 length:882 start_codon:yes stop_codon:yes gene_type:complete